MSIARNTLVQSGLTLVSRLLGFARDVILAAKIGAGPIGDAWVTAQMFPNLFRRIFAEGAFASAFVPAYARTLEADGPEAARVLAQDALRVVFVASAGLTILFQLFMPFVLLIIHGGQSNDKENYALAVALTQITMPYLTFMSIAALLSGVLNSAEKFALSAGVPTLLNVCLIAAALLSRGRIETTYFCAIAIMISGLLQTAILWWGVSRQKIKLGLIGWPRLTPDVKKILALAVPGVLAGSGTQINILVSQSLASLEVGAKSWLYAADRLYQLPLGLVGVAVAIAILPRLSRAARANDETAGARTMDEGIGLAMALTLPAAASLMVAPLMLIDGFFARGAFTSADARMSAAALYHFAWGVPAFVLIKVLSPPFFAREDTKSPMRFALASVIVNTIAGAGLFFWYREMGQPGFIGLAIATSLAAWVNALLLAFGLVQRGWYRPGGPLISGVLRAGLASALMAGLVWFLIYNFDAVREATGGTKEAAATAIVFAGGMSYTVFALLTGALRIRDIRQALRRS
jgi:putative peptidoglycan lipid II flippase